MIRPSELRRGQFIYVRRFSCMATNSRHEVLEDHRGLYCICSEGRHPLTDAIYEEGELALEPWPES
jgi:hypothetical protein